MTTSYRSAYDRDARRLPPVFFIIGRRFIIGRKIHDTYRDKFLILGLQDILTILIMHMNIYLCIIKVWLS